MAQDDAKTFSLKEIEKQMLVTAAQAYQAQLSNFVSFIMMERLAVPVDENTRFELAGDFSEVKVWQEVPEEPAAPITNETPSVDLKGKK